MEISEFMEAHKSVVKESGSKLSHITAFGGVESNDDDVLNLFSNDTEEEEEEDESGIEWGSEEEEEEDDESDEGNLGYSVASNLQDDSEVSIEFPPIDIQSVNFQSKEKEEMLTFEGMIREFFQCHFIDTSGYSDEKLFLVWNDVYNDNVNSFSEMLQKYYKVRYGIFFVDAKVFEAAVAKGMEFMSKLQFCRRAITEADLEMYEKYGSEPWFSQKILNDFSNEPGFNPLLLEVMKRDIDMSDMYRFRVNSMVLMYAIKLLLSGKLNLSLFNQAIDSYTVEAYYKSCFDSNDDRFDPIRGRNDFPELYNLVLNLEYSGRVIRDEVIKEFADAYYLRTILIAESENRLDERFAKAYLWKKLGDWEFIVSMYENDEINIGLSRTSVVHSKILTDLLSHGLNTENFTMEFSVAARCLLLSRFHGNLSELDYVKFLIACSASGGTHVLRRLNLMKKKISSYNLFWIQELIKDFHLEIPDRIDSTIGDNLARYVFSAKGNVRTTFTLDAFVLDPEGFSKEMEGMQFARVIYGGHGLILSNWDVIVNTKISGNFVCDSSLSCWVKKGLSPSLMKQFSQYDSITHCSLLQAMNAATENFKQKTVISETGSKINSEILDFLKIPLVEYYRYDKVFSYVQEHPMYLGLFKSVYGYDFLKMLAKSILYDNPAKVLFHFLRLILNMFFKSKAVSDTSSFKTLNAHRQILLVTGLEPNECTFGMQVFIDSIDSFMVSFKMSSSILLKVESETIYLSISQGNS